MSTPNTVEVVYFSGTGGTARVAAHTARAFEKRGLAVTVTELSGRPATRAPADALALLYPVYAANAPQPVDEWIASAPEGEGRPTMVLSVSGGGEVSPNTACRTEVIRRLERKGYRVIYEDMIVMPANFLKSYSDELTAHLLRVAPERAAFAAEAFLSGTVRRTRPHLWDRAITKVCAAEKRGSRMFGERLSATDACVGCGWCEAHCPRGNIRLSGGRPAFGSACVLCLRCVYGCPEKAIRPGVLGFAILPGGFDLDAAEARTAGMAELPPIRPITRGWVLSGVRKYLLEK